MSWWLDLAKLVSPKAADAVRDGVTAMRSAHTVRQHRYIIEAIGPSYCLEMSQGVSGRVSFDSIDRRIAIEQRQKPEEASGCGIPNLDDPNRRAKLKQILYEMQDAGKLRYHHNDTWSVV